MVKLFSGHPPNNGLYSTLYNTLYLVVIQQFCCITTFIYLIYYIKIPVQKQVTNFHKFKR